MDHQKREIKYDEDVGAFLVDLKKSGKVQHVEVIKQRCERFSFNAEKQTDTNLLDSNTCTYETIIKAYELDGFNVPQGYRIILTISQSTVLILSIRYTLDAF